LYHWIVFPFDPGVPDSIVGVPEHMFKSFTMGTPGSGFIETTALPLIIFKQPERFAWIVYVPEVAIPVNPRPPPSGEL
jgi:hypothetical protein